MNICPTCNNPSGFSKNGREKTFCTRECRGKDSQKNIEIKCIGCKGLFNIRPCEIKTKKYCSMKCKKLIKVPRPERRTGNFIECPFCKNKKYVCKSTLALNKTGEKFCSIKCKNSAMKCGLTKWSFQDEGKPKISNPHIRIQINKKRSYEHRLIMEEHLGRKLESNELIHHINEDPKDNRIENLMIVTNEEHGKIHKPKRSI